MGKTTGFLEFGREEEPLRPIRERVGDWREVFRDWPSETTRTQAARCMDCGIPVCTSGCPLGNSIPDWNDLLYRDRWERALQRLHSTNNFPEFTGITCPAPCEPACVLALNDGPVAIRQIEWEIVRRGWEEGWIRPRPPKCRTGRHVAIVGSGPAGLAAAQQLNRAGHGVTVFEARDRPGGLLTYGIPDFKLEKWLVARRVDQLVREGVRFRTGLRVGIDLSPQALRRRFDAVLLCIGAEEPEDLSIPGRQLDGVHFALDFLIQQNLRIQGRPPSRKDAIHAHDRQVVVIGGGDTASDCVGTALRQGARSVTTLQLWERPPEAQNPLTPWPDWPRIFRSSSSHDEGGRREFAVCTRRFSGRDGRLERLHAQRVRVREPDAQGRGRIEPVPEGRFFLPVDLALIAIGYAHPAHEGLVAELDLVLDADGNIAADTESYHTSQEGVFSAGDCRRGQSLIVWAIAEGREAARCVDLHLMGRSRLPLRGGGV